MSEVRLRRAADMTRDGRTAALVDKCVRKLKANGLKAAQISVPPLAINDDFFEKRIVGMSSQTSQRLRRELHKASLLRKKSRWVARHTYL